MEEEVLVAESGPVEEQTTLGMQARQKGEASQEVRQEYLAVPLGERSLQVLG